MWLLSWNKKTTWFLTWLLWHPEKPGVWWRWAFISERGKQRKGRETKRGRLFFQVKKKKKPWIYFGKHSFNNGPSWTTGLTRLLVLSGLECGISLQMKKLVRTREPRLSCVWSKIELAGTSQRNVQSLNFIHFLNNHFSEKSESGEGKSFPLMLRMGISRPIRSLTWEATHEFISPNPQLWRGAYL